MVQMLSDALIKEKGLFNVIELSLDWAARAGTKEAIFTKDVHPGNWFSYSDLESINKEAFEVWWLYHSIANSDLIKFIKLDDVSKLVFAIKSENNLQNFNFIPEKLFFDTYKKSGLESKQMKALQKLYKD
jgi:hypothetical protein